MTDREQEDFERRLAGLEMMAVDAVGSARKCIINSMQCMNDALERHGERLRELENLVVKIEEALTKLEDSRRTWSAGQISRESTSLNG